MCKNTAQAAGVTVYPFHEQGKICIAGRAETKAELKILMHVLSQLGMKLCGKFEFDAESLPNGADYKAAYEQYKTTMAMLTYVRDNDTVTVYERAVNLYTYMAKVSELQLPSRYNKDLKTRTYTCTSEQATASSPCTRRSACTASRAARATSRPPRCSPSSRAPSRRATRPTTSSASSPWARPRRPSGRRQRLRTP